MSKGGSFGGGGKFGARSSQRAADSRTSISKPGAGGPTPRPAGDDTIARYNGFPMDRVTQTIGMVGSVLSGSVMGLIGGVMQDDGTMTKPDGWSKFGKENDTAGGVGQMERMRRRRYAAQIGNTLGIADTSLGA